MFHAGRPYQDSETRGAKRRSLGEAPGEWQRMWSGREGSPMPLIAVSVTLKVVLTMAIEALHVVPKPR